jgi:hypothetical protein
MKKIAAVLVSALESLTGAAYLEIGFCDDQRG